MKSDKSKLLVKKKASVDVNLVKTSEKLRSIKIKPESISFAATGKAPKGKNPLEEMIKVGT